MSDNKHESTASVPQPALGQGSFTQRVVEVFLRGNLSVMLLMLSLLAGVVALLVVPREDRHLAKQN